ncbi:MAG: hypothetical protein O3B95_08170 [Chloroflexi bacterium]|nr:hypothetical protein [Chloroflexota bacterium]
MLGGTANLESRFRIVLLKREEIIKVAGDRLAEQLTGNRILGSYTDDATHPLYLIVLS